MTTQTSFVIAALTSLNLSMISKMQQERWKVHMGDSTQLPLHSLKAQILKSMTAKNNQLLLS